MRKKLFLCIVLGAVCSVSFFAQGVSLVYDPENVIATIENGYQLVKNFEAMVEQIKASYEMVEMQIKNMQEMDWTKGWEEIKSPQDLIDNYRNLMTLSDRLASYNDIIREQFTAPNYQILGMSFSAKDLFAQGEDAEGNKFVKLNKNTFKEMMGEVTYSATHKMTASEKAAFNAKYGLSPEHYFQYQALKEVGVKASQDVLGLARGLYTNLVKDQQVLDTLATAPDNGSQVSILQKSIAVSQWTATKFAEFMQLYGMNLERQMMKEQQAEVENANKNDMRDTYVTAPLEQTKEFFKENTRGIEWKPLQNTVRIGTGAGFEIDTTYTGN